MSYSVVAVMLTSSIVQEAFIDVYVQEQIETLLLYKSLCGLHMARICIIVIILLLETSLEVGTSTEYQSIVLSQTLLPLLLSIFGVYFRIVLYPIIITFT